MAVKKVTLQNRKRTSDLGDGEAVAAKKAELKAIQAETMPNPSSTEIALVVAQIVAGYQKLKSTGTSQRRQYNDLEIQKQLIQNLKACVNQKAEAHVKQGISLSENQFLCQNYLDTLCEALALQGLPHLRLRVFPS